MVADRKDIAWKTDLDLEDLGGSPMNNTWTNLKYGGLNETFQARKPSLERNEDRAYSKCNRCAKGCHVGNYRETGGSYYVSQFQHVM